MAQGDVVISLNAQKAQQGERALIDVAGNGWADHVAALLSAGVDKARILAGT